MEKKSWASQQGSSIHSLWVGWYLSKQAKKNGLLTHQLYTSYHFHYICKQIKVKHFLSNLKSINVHLQLFATIARIELVKVYYILFISYTQSFHHSCMYSYSQLTTDYDIAHQLESSKTSMTYSIKYKILFISMRFFYIFLLSDWQEKSQYVSVSKVEYHKEIQSKVRFSMTEKLITERRTLTGLSFIVKQRKQLKKQQPKLVELMMKGVIFRKLIHIYLQKL